MFGRVAACGIAAVLLVAPRVSSGEPTAFAAVPDATITQAAAADPITIQDDIPARPKLAALEPVDPGIASPSRAQPFGRNAVPLRSGEILAKWSAVTADIRAENEIFARCRVDAGRCPAVAKKFLAIIDAGAALQGRARIGTINRDINLAIRPMSDLAQWGVEDRWSAPLDTFTTGRGDCEDYAIAKYVALLAAGVDAADLRLVIVRDVASGEDHAVAAVRNDAGWLILDNRFLTLVGDADMRGALPLFVLDEDGVKIFWGTAPGAPRAAAPASLRIAD